MERITGLVQDPPISTPPTLLIDKIHHAIRSGQSVSVLISQYIDLLRDVEKYVRDPAARRIAQKSGPEWQVFIVSLLREAYDANHPEVAQELLSLLQGQDSNETLVAVEHLRTWNQVIAEAKAIIKRYKVTSTADIRNQHFVTLYDPNVSDESKRAIWSQQWSQSTFDELPGHSDAVLLALIKMGKKDQVLRRVYVDDMVYPPINDELLAVAAYKQGYFDLLETHLDTATAYRIANSLVKKGYFRALSEFLKNTNLDWTIFHLMSEAETMHLPQLELLNSAVVTVINSSRRSLKLPPSPIQSQQGLSPEYGLAVHSPPKLLEPISMIQLYPLAIEYANDNLFQELRAAYPDRFRGRESLVYLLQMEEELTPKHLPIVATILKENHGLREDNQSLQKLRLFLRANQYFFVEIYKKYGLLQFESSLIYLRAQFGVTFDYEGLVTAGIVLGDVQLLTYMFNLDVDYDTDNPLLSRIEGEDRSLLDAKQVDLPDAIKVSLGRRKPELTAVLLLIKHYRETGDSKLKLRD